MNAHCILKTDAVGDLLLIASATHLLGVSFADGEAAPASLHSSLEAGHPILRSAARQIEEYLAGQRKQFTVPLHVAGTPFQQSVWRNIAAIGFGESITYGELAARSGAPRAVRAAGSATGRNPIALIIPCHRILGAHGGLGGFAGGLERKVRLLELEGIRLKRNSIDATSALRTRAPHVHAGL